VVLNRTIPVACRGADVFYDPSATLTYGDQERTKGDNIDRLVDDIKRRYVLYP
jgi:hypothetical protein